MTALCTWCGKTWTGQNREHCTACHETFNSHTAGEAHRKGEYPHRRCDTTGMTYDEQRGVWITERMPEHTHRNTPAA